jgi:hypothetical protein
MRPPVAPPAGLPAVPTVVEPIGAPPALDVDPEELAVPAELVPGILDALALPTPVCTENLSSGVVVVKSAKDGV